MSKLEEVPPKGELKKDLDSPALAPEQEKEEKEREKKAAKRARQKARKHVEKDGTTPEASTVPSSTPSSSSPPTTTIITTTSSTPSVPIASQVPSSKAEAPPPEDESGDDDDKAVAGQEGEKKKKKKKKKKPSSTVSVPSVPITKQFLGKALPEGKFVEYIGNHAFRRQDKACQDRDKLEEARLNDLRCAAEAHRQLRAYARSTLRPGVKLFDFVESLEHAGRQLLECDGYKHIQAGIAFPTGVSLNNCAAHYTPNPGDETCLQAGDIIKIDIGTHVRGNIIDSAFTMSFDPQMDRLIEASREATKVGLRAAGIDALLRDIGNEIDEVFSSYEVEIGGKTYRCKPVRNLQGHSLGPYIIHAGKSVPIAHNVGDTVTRMEEGELYAIETFATTGRGTVNDDMDCSHYMMDPEAEFAAVRNPKARHLLGHIKAHYETLAFCRRWLDAAGETRHLLTLKSLVDQGLVNAYPPLCDVRGSFVSQHEHTVFLRPTGKEIISAGIEDDV